MKIFSTGLQRTGTMSLTKALNQLGFPAKQFPKELYHDIHHPTINEYQAFTDFPIPLLYHELDKAFPGSKFIHTIRDEQKWLNSVRWLFSTGQVKFNVAKNDHAQIFHQDFYGTTYFDESVFLARYREYNAETAAYFAERPDDFLIIDLTAGEGYEKLCPFLGVPFPDEPFPNTNKSESLGKVKANKLKNQSRKRLRELGNRTRFRPLLQTFKGILSPIPLTSPAERLSCRPFFIISSGRSGSTLLRAIINAHPAICIPPESQQLGFIVQRFNKSFRFLPWSLLPSLIAAEFQKSQSFSFWEMEIAGFYRQASKLPLPDQNLARLIDIFYNSYRQIHKPAAIRWGDKSIRNVKYLAQLNALYPTAQFIHIVRDGRDVAVSLYNQGLFQNPVAAADHWLDRVTRAKNFGQQIPVGRFLEIHYERLIQEPESTVQQVCEFLALDYQPEMLEFWRQVDKLGDTDRALHENLKNPINSTAIGKWRQQLNSSQQAQIEQQLAPLLTNLGYD